MIIEIEPLDTLFFRDGKPFTMGDDTWANAMFPPMPSVLYGAIRSAYLGQNDIDVGEIEEKTRDFKIEGIAYAVEGKDEDGDLLELTYFPAPSNLVTEVEPPLSLNDKERIEWYQDRKYHEEEYELFQGRRLSNIKATTPSSLSKLLVEELMVFQANNKVESVSNAIINKDDLQRYFNGEDDFQLKLITNITLEEPKIGIGRNNSTFTAAEGNLYRVGLIRASKIKIYIKTSGITLKDNQGVLKLGGESKLASYIVHRDDFIQVNKNNIETIRPSNFSIYLSTPALFEKGFHPTKVFEETKAVVNLKGCAIGKAINVGGFDMKSRSPKLMRKAVPAGTVFQYELIDGDFSELAAYVKENGISEYRSNEGFGIAYIY